MPDKDDPVAAEAWRREASHHEGHRDFRPHLRPVGANLIGLRGEQAFGETFDLPVNLAEMPGGDNQTDFEVTMAVTFKVNCKAAVTPKDLIVEVSKCRPNIIYVLCRYWPEEDRCTLIGWQWGSVLMRSTPKDYGYGVVNYWQPAGKLRPIEELKMRRL